MAILIVAGFKIRKVSGGFTCTDTCKFNNWGTMRHVIANLDDAKDFARRCDAFKCGRTMASPHDAPYLAD